ncbi:MAG TPA: response regulator transcription factor, partial [Flavobacteriales bacterium]|nr:response regulator transcription factor [Flavobacteriales bacterium]
TQPYGYIIKPFKEIDIHTSIEMALYKHKKEAEVLKERDLLFNLVEGQASGKDLLFVKSNSRLVKLRTSDIYFVEALKDYVVINTLNMRYTIHSTMKDIESKLPEAEFLRVHRSFIVRIDKIVAIEQPNLILENDKKIIPIGGSYRDELAKRLNLV